MRKVWGSGVGTERGGERQCMWTAWNGVQCLMVRV